MTSVLRPTSIIAAVVVVATVLALVLAPPPTEAPTSPAAVATASPSPSDGASPAVEADAAQVVVDAQAGAWYCPADDPDVADGDGQVVAVRPALDQRPARFTTRVIGDPGVIQIGELFPGAGQQVNQPEDALEVRWTERPVTVSRLALVDEEPAGALARPCQARVAANWTLPGMTTAAGATVALRLTNPLSQEASVAVRGLTPQGIEAPIRLQNISVPPGETVVVELADYLPQQPDLALDVTARSGRIVVDAILSSQPTVSGVNGRSALVATARPGTRWFVPWVATSGRPDGRGTDLPIPTLTDPAPLATATPSATPTPASTPTPTPTASQATEPAATETASATPDPTEEATPAPDASEAIDDILDVVVEGDAVPSSWLWLANPTDEPADVQLSFLTSQGRIAGDVLGTIEVGAGAVRRLVLDDILPDVPGDVGVDVQVTNDVPIAVAGATVVDDGATAARTGIAVMDAVAVADDVVTVTTVSAPDRTQWLTLANPFGVRAVLDLQVWNGTTSQSPEDLRGIVLAPGQVVAVDMSEWATGTGEFTVFAVAIEGSLTASLRGLAAEGPLRFTATAGVPMAIWTADGSLVGVTNEDGLVNRLGTDLGLPAAVETASPTAPPSIPDTEPLPTASPSTVAPSASPSASAPPSPEATDPSTSAPTGTPSATDSGSPTG